MKMYVTFGQSHVHRVNGKTFDKDCVAVIECTDHIDGRRQAFELFGDKFSVTYMEDRFTFEKCAAFYPRGLICAN